MSKDAEVDMKEVELNEMDPEKQPMTADGQSGGEKNGTVMLKVPEEEVTFTGLSKEELMKVAGTPGWVRTRWVLLVLFWLGWVGMLAGAVAIIVQAPRCKPIPDMNWWNEGPLYQVNDVNAFSPNGMKELDEKLESVNNLKVKGLVLGPMHTVQANQAVTLNMQEINPTHGTQEELMNVLEKAHKKGISVVLDLTPNYLGGDAWFSTGDVPDVLEKLAAAADFWLNLGIDGIKVSDVNVAASSLYWSKLKNVFNRTEETKKRALLGVVKGLSAVEVHELVNTTGVDLVLSDLLSAKATGVDRAQDLDSLHSIQRNIGWGLGAASQDQMSKLAGTPALMRLNQLLLFTLPGTPVFTYGDEIGLQAEGAGSPMMVWDIEKEPTEGQAVNETVEAERKERLAVRKWFNSLSELRGKERSLLYGEYSLLQSSPTTLAYLRLWDQSERYITAVNWGSEPATITLTAPAGVELPETGKVKLSSDPELKADASVSLEKITLGPGSGVLLQFPYPG
ncbi:amino acid transporter heavy chain SLC3A2-like [Genypterus blacodes]|uniref:amino acid transporter heavy chain SLC3A2-like n=1 Tax=Genypterus blacodes TaxID=154954 RepID=UPI003F768A0F